MKSNTTKIIASSYVLILADTDFEFKFSQMSKTYLEALKYGNGGIRPEVMMGKNQLFL